MKTEITHLENDYFKVERIISSSDKSTRFVIPGTTEHIMLKYRFADLNPEAKKLVIIHD